MFDRNAAYVAAACTALVSVLAGCSGAVTSATPAPVARVASRAQLASRPDSLPLNRLGLTSVLRPDMTFVPAPDTSSGFVDSDVARAAVIVADSSSNAIYVYTTTGHLTATITGFNEPQGLARDRMGDLYVANTNANDILVYKKDYKTLVNTLFDRGAYPAGVAFDLQSGLVGVANILSAGDAPGSVSFYAKGANKPCKTVTSPDFGRVYDGAFAEGGDFYVDGLDSSGQNTVVGVVKGGCSATSIEKLTTSNTIGFPGDVKVTRANTIAIDDQVSQALYTYDLPQNGALGKPRLTTSLKFTSDPVSFAFTMNGKDVWVSNVALPRGEAMKYFYPAGGSTLETFYTGKIPVGIIVIPPPNP